MYERSRHAAVRTRDYIFNQLIPYIGNKRRLLGLLADAIGKTDVTPRKGTFVDLFAGSGVVSRFAKQLGFRVIANDWEPYTLPINTCYVACNHVPAFASLGGYESAIGFLNSLPPSVDWVTTHLCPRSDESYDTRVDRMFYMRKNGMRIDAIRNQVEEWMESAVISQSEEACLLAPLLYQACYTSNTSGVFKGFHNGWGGKTGTALYRIGGDLSLSPAVLLDNGRTNEAHCVDAAKLSLSLVDPGNTIVYLDPPYNQHPYGSNYHVLNSVALWDKPHLPSCITKGTKAAIRTDWRTARRSAYNYADEATRAYRRLLDAQMARFVLTSYSTDGTIPLGAMLSANVKRGRVTVEMQGYKRYRVSSQRFSEKPMNVEFVVILDTARAPNTTVEELATQIADVERRTLNAHPEVADKRQRLLFEGV